MSDKVQECIKLISPKFFEENSSLSVNDMAIALLFEMNAERQKNQEELEFLRKGLECTSPGLVKVSVGVDQIPDTFPHAVAIRRPNGDLVVKRSGTNEVIGMYPAGHWMAVGSEPPGGTLGANERDAIPVDDEGEDDAES